MAEREIRDVWRADACQLTETSSIPGRLPTAREVRVAWLQLLGASLALGVLAGVLPGPWATLAVLVGRDSSLTGEFGGLAVGDTAMLLVAAILVWALLLWALAVATMAGLSRLPGAGGVRARQVLARVAPIAVRRVLLTVVGASMVTGLTACGTSTTAATDAGPRVAVVAVSSTNTRLVDGATQVDAPTTQARSWIAVEGSAVHLRAALPSSGPVDRHAIPVDRDAIPVDRHAIPVDRNAARLDSSAPPKGPVGVDWPTTGTGSVDWPTTGTGAGGGVVVLRGDSLWSIAARHLPPSAGPTDIDSAWHAWYAANLQVIGSDPNLILPGQILLPPDSGTGP